MVNLLFFIYLRKSIVNKYIIYNDTDKECVIKSNFDYSITIQPNEIVGIDIVELNAIWCD